MRIAVLLCLLGLAVAGSPCGTVAPGAPVVAAKKELTLPEKIGIGLGAAAGVAAIGGGIAQALAE